MDFSKFDIVLLSTMGLAVILMSFTFPALGLSDTADEQNETDVPEFNISQDRFNTSQDFPDKPGSPTEGTLEYDESTGNSIPGQTLVWIDRPKTTGTSIEVQNRTSDANVRWTNWSSTGTVRAEDVYSLGGTEGQTILHQNESWVIEFEVTEMDNYRQDNMTFEVEWEILEQPTDSEGGGLSSIPIVGGLFSAGEQLVSALAWIGLIIRWGVASFFVGAAGLALTAFDVVIFAVDISVWLITTYNSIVGSATTAWAKTILVVPLLLVFGEFFKMSMIGVRLVRG